MRSRTVSLVICSLPLLSVACSPISTKHKIETAPIETKHTIEAHIVIEIIERDMSKIEDAVRSPQENPAEKKDGVYRQFMRFLAAGMASNAYADGEESEEMKNAIQRRQERFEELSRLKADGAVGENNRGAVELRENDRTARDPDYKKKVEELVNKENADRDIIYAEYSRTKGFEVEEVRKGAANVNREKANPGDWIQTPEGEWKRKE